MTESTRQRRVCYFEGRVQGVGFRYTTREIAQDFPVSGFVRNLPDGRVELVAEGAPEQLDAFIGRLRERMGSFITHYRTSTQPATGEFTGFAVRH